MVNKPPLKRAFMQDVSKNENEASNVDVSNNNDVT